MNAFNKLRFVIQSALLLGILRLTLKVLPGLKVYLKSTVPLALAGITGSMLRLFYNDWVPFRMIVEQVALMSGLILAMLLPGRELGAGRISHISCALVGLLVFLVIVPVPL
ncbi:hypothetical protein A3L02_02150 [Thermococcus celer Vu 13 = JCM 8558]|uniref:Uncharacterized protein n=2 Tax=Thermococcus celer TaxID=2264 RepID=A0A218P0K7_THECE|nr:hypothetical protein A3L02_02150 [Thermococcus celer Vu 13 = JCM 8558]